MEISETETLQRLRQWQDESRAVDARFAKDGLKAFMLGILLLDWPILAIVSKCPETRMTIDLSGAHYEYRYAHEAPEPVRQELMKSYDGTLTILLPKAIVYLNILHKVTNAEPA
jgi:hypothetical protein